MKNWLVYHVLEQRSSITQILHQYEALQDAMVLKE